MFDNSRSRVTRVWRRELCRLARQRDRFRFLLPRVFARFRLLLARAFPRLGLSSALLVVGLLVLGYVGWSYASMFWQQRQLETEWIRQQSVLPPFEGSSSTVDLPADARARVDPLTRLTIPTIGLDAIVVPGTSEKSLKIGPGWMTDTAQPGEVGNSVISGHRDTFFRHIVELKKGDVVEVSRAGRVFKYAVIGKKVVPPDDMSVLRPSKDRELTLITCYPIYYIGPAPDRLIVFTKALDAEEANVKAAAGGQRP